MAEERIDLPKPKKRKLFFSKQVDQSSIEELTKQIITINESDDYLKQLYKLHDLDYTPQPIEIYIDSYGGMVYQIFGLVGVMEKSQTPIHTICTGAAMSAGFIMLIHGHKRFAYEHATPLYHQVSGGISGKVRDMEEELSQYLRVQYKMEEMTIRKTKISQKELDKIKKRKKDWFMTAEEALKLKVIDEII